MDLEIGQLDLRHEALRRRSAAREARLLASIAQIGQQLPVVVVVASDRHVLVDGYKRVRALGRLGQDTVRAMIWDLLEPEALMLERLLRAADADAPLEEGYFLRDLRDRFGLSLGEIARRFDRSTSWVSRRLALVAVLPEAVGELVRRGEIGAHGAMKFLVPLARANPEECARFARAVGSLRPSSRQLGELCGAFMRAGAEARERLLADPSLLLRACEEARRAEPAEQPPAAMLLSELGALGGLARRVDRRLREGLARALSASERKEVRRCARQTKADVRQLVRRLEEEVLHARPEHAAGDPAPA